MFAEIYKQFVPTFYGLKISDRIIWKRGKIQSTEVQDLPIVHYQFRYILYALYQITVINISYKFKTIITKYFISIKI